VVFVNACDMTAFNYDDIQKCKKRSNEQLSLNTPRTTAFIKALKKEQNP